MDKIKLESEESQPSAAPSSHENATSGEEISADPKESSLLVEKEKRQKHDDHSQHFSGVDELLDFASQLQFPPHLSHEVRIIERDELNQGSTYYYKRL